MQQHFYSYTGRWDLYTHFTGEETGVEIDEEIASWKAQLLTTPELFCVVAETTLFLLLCLLLLGQPKGCIPPSLCFQTNAIDINKKILTACPFPNSRAKHAWKFLYR